MTVSCSEKIIKNLVSRKHISSEGVVMEGEENGVRRIFLRALVDSPILIEDAH